MNVREFVSKKIDEKENLNCASFALGINHWLLLDDWNGGVVEDREELEERAIQKILKYCPNIRQINTPTGIKKGEYLVLFRVGYYQDDWFENEVLYDFHFVVRTGRGKYLHKRGMQPEILKMNESEVFGESWNDTYNGKIYYFARPIEG